MKVNNVEVTGNCYNIEEINNYINRYKEKNPHKNLKSINLELDGEYVNITYYTEKVPFERIRRITGYLVGDMNRWNNAKKSEENDRVKHSI